MIDICLIGAGRIGSIHGENISKMAGCKLSTIVDQDPKAAKTLASKLGSTVSLLDDVNADAYMICSATESHAPMLRQLASRGKPIFCEKPIALNEEEILLCMQEVKVPVLMGFNRRFDPSFRALYNTIQEGEIGLLEQLSITSRDPAPPPLHYLEHCGGIFHDMTIHDFDMARWLSGGTSFELSVFTQKVLGTKWVDGAVISMRTDAGTLIQIINSRRAVYGYDQRIEAFGDKGMVQAENVLPTTLKRSCQNAVYTDCPEHFFLERYKAAYKLELDHFLNIVRGEVAPECTLEDAYAAFKLAEETSRLATMEYSAIAR